MSFWNPTAYFNGSKFYRLRNKYTEQYFEAALKVIRQEGLKVCDLNDSTRTITLSNDQRFMYQEAKANNTLSATKKKLEREFLKGSIGWVKWVDENNVKVHRKGLRSFCESLAMHRATRETGYVWHLVSDEIRQSWLNQAIIQIIVLIASEALKAIPFTGWAAYVVKFVAYTSWYGSLIAYMTLRILELKDMYDKTKINHINALDLSEKLSVSLNARANDMLRHKKYIGESAKLFSGIRIYASGDIYMSEAAGSESFCPTQSFTPYKHFLPKDAKEPQEEGIDEQIQNRAHYTEAGNKGYNANPYIPQAQIKKLDHDSAFKKNYFTLHNQRLQRGYAKLCAFIIDEYEPYVKRTAYSASEWIQAVYDNDIDFYKNVLYTYLQSKDMLYKLERYNYALRADFDYFNRFDRSYESRQDMSISDTRGLSEEVAQYESEQEAQSEDKDQEEALNMLISLKAMAQEQESGEYSEERDYFDTQGEVFLGYKRAFIQQMSEERDILKMLIHEELKVWYLSEYKGVFYGIVSEEIMEQYREHIMFLQYAQSIGVLDTKGGYGVLYVDLETGEVGVELRDERIEEDLKRAFSFG
ncbi:hypothetical protein LS68_009160 [Helicobacter sp. MIT 05-5293]|uniref:hypothetical protein n=1 Tax=unclassified Helicobacter TaxID=2593540 RepID=UPI00051FDF8D|nr:MULTISPECIES: hypothetical protein [unclassified Helicobacter]TLD79831.1 hypothetical protein LS68_009160 [Helicobacter sp. MIT 05-5293]TLD85542.1 hypothetical protein LS69_009125 [Helicobacter sp. MIT 05-5294]